MKAEEFVTLGVSEDLAKKAEEASQNELKGYIPKARFDEVNEAKKKLETDAKEHEKQLSELKSSAGDNEELKKQIASLQEENKKKEDQYQADLKELSLNNAIKSVLSGKAHDDDLVTTMFDKTKLILGDDGKVTGLEEQLKSLKESKPFLFKTEENKEEPKPGFHKIGGEPATNNNQGNSNPSLKDAISSYFQQTK